MVETNETIHFENGEKERLTESLKKTYEERF
ncbi:MAG: hypothetical protein RJA25_682 [Bacteroidota bacterium]|jgi:hypothetical protein